MTRKKRKRIRFPLQIVAGLGILLVVAGFIYAFRSTFFSPPCANSLSCEESLTLKVENGKEGTFNGRQVAVPAIDLAKQVQASAVLGEDSDAAEKHIYINLETQLLSAYEGDELFMETPISSGLWGKTPTGEFTIWIKIRSTTMSGGSGADYYYLPNVPHVMYFSNSEVPASRGFGIHGTYWHNNFGHPMSHGCINMRNVDVAKLYEWANPVSDGHTTHSTKMNPGTKITIHDGLEH